MIAYKCDRCGAVFEKLERDKDRLYITRFLGTSNSFYDLCPTCNNELREWFVVPRRVESEDEK